MVHLSMVMVSIPIMVNLMASIIRTTTLLRVTRNNLTIENHILANLNKVNILTLTSPSVSLTEELSPSMTSTLSPSMTNILSLSMTLIVGLPRHSMTLTEVLSLNKINILIPAILSRHIVDQSIDHQPSRRVVIQLLQTINPSLFLILALIIDKRNRKTSTPVESLAVMQLTKDPVARTQISLRIIRNLVDTKMKVMTTLVFMKICLVPILWRKFLQN